LTSTGPAERAIRVREAGGPARERQLRSRGQRTLAKLLDAGREVLAQSGYQAARVDDIVREAKLSHGTFYRYFTDKEDLVHALARECVVEMVDLAISLGPVDGGRDGLAELRRWLDGFLATYRRYGMVIRVFMEERNLDRELYALGVDAFGQIASSFAEQFEKVQRPHPLNPQVAAAALLAMVERFTYLAVSRPLWTPDDVALDTLAVLIHRGFFGGRVLRSR
jgi:AcrR family transcriptional regulator